MSSIYARISVSEKGLPESALSEAATPTIASLAVLPLRNSPGDPEQTYLSDGVI